MAIRMKTVVTYKTTAQCPSHSRTEIPMRDLTTVIDEPLERGGTNMGITPTETVLAALIACTNVIGHKCAAKLDIDIGEITIDAQCDFDRRGVTLQEEIDVPFPRATLIVTSKGPATAEQLDQVANETAKFCAISKMFQASGTDVTVTWQKA